MKLWERRLAAMTGLVLLLCVAGCRSEQPQTQPQPPENQSQQPTSQPEQAEDPYQPNAEDLYRTRQDTMLEDLKGVSFSELLYAYCVGDGDAGLTGFLLREDLPGLMDCLQLDQWQATEILLSGPETGSGARLMGIYLDVPPEGRTVETFDLWEGSQVLHQIAITREGDLAYNAFLQGDDRFFAYQMPGGATQRVRDYVLEHRVPDEEFYAMHRPDY